MLKKMLVRTFMGRINKAVYGAVSAIAVWMAQSQFPFISDPQVIAGIQALVIGAVTYFVPNVEPKE